MERLHSSTHNQRCVTEGEIQIVESCRDHAEREKKQETKVRTEVTDMKASDG